MARFLKAKINLIAAFAAISTLAIGSGLLAVPVNAEDKPSTTASQNITITPATQPIDIEPGQSSNSKITVVNQGKDAFSVKLSASAFRVEGDNYSPIFDKGDAEIDASKWLELSKTDIDSLKPYKSEDVSYKITVPDGIAAGGYYLVVFAESSPLAAGTGVTSNNRVGQIIYLTVKGDFKMSGFASAEKLPGIIFKSQLSIPVDVTNDGQAHFNTEINVKVKDFFGNQVSNIKEDRYVLPSTTRKTVINQDFPGLVNVFEIQRTASVPGKTIDLGSSKVIYVAPIPLITIIGALIILTAILLSRRKSDRKRR